MQTSQRNGFAWTTVEGVPASDLEPLFARFPEVGSVSGASEIKRNHFREVYHVPPDAVGSAAANELLANGLLVKVYRYTSRWDRLRFRFIRARAEQEWTALARFGEFGLATAIPIGVSVWKQGKRLLGGGLVASFLPGTDALGTRLHALAQASDLDAAAVPAQAARILSATGDYLRRLHDHGVWHRDLHGGNFLVSREDDKVYLIDLHTCVFLRKLYRWQARQGVVKLLHSLQFSVPRHWLRPLLEAYGHGRLYPGCGPEQEEERLFRGVARLERKRLRSRAKRCFKPSTRFEVKRSRAERYYRLRARQDVAWGASELEPVYRESPPADAIKVGPDGWVAALPTASSGLVCVKYRRLSLLEGLQALVESHRLRRAYAAGHAFWVHNLPAPQVLALRERLVFGVVREAFLVTEFVSGAASLDRFVKERYYERPAPCGADARARHRLARRVGRLAREVHRSGFYPHDLSPQNVLVTSQALEEENDPFAGLHMVDLDHLYLWQPLWERGRRKNLVQLANLCEGHVTATDRLRALKEYCDRNASSPYWQPSWVRAIGRRLLTEHRRVLDEFVRRENEVSQC